MILGAVKSVVPVVPNVLENRFRMSSGADPCDEARVLLPLRRLSVRAAVAPHEAVS
jgi:hypothetical protein